MADPNLVKEIVRRAQMRRNFGTGFTHGSLPLHEDTWEEIVRFVLDEAEVEQAEQIREAIHRVNVDWDEVARTCGDPKCEGDCRWVRVLRENGALQP